MKPFSFLYSFWMIMLQTGTSKITIIHSQIGNKIFFEILIYFCLNLFIKSNCDASLRRTVEVRREDKIRKVKRIKGKEWIISHFTGGIFQRWKESPDEKKKKKRIQEERKESELGFIQESETRCTISFSFHKTDNSRKHHSESLSNSTKAIVDVWYIDTPVLTSG